MCPVDMLKFLCFLFPLCFNHITGAVVPLNRSTRYSEVKPLEFNCTGIPDGYFVHPSSCSEYYACVGGTPFKSKCLPGLLFHASTQYCENENVVNCTQLTGSMTKPTETVTTTTMTTTTRRTTTEMTTTRKTTPAPSGHVDCSGHPSGTLLRNPADCTKYWECDGSATVPFTCPGNTVFREEIHGCDYRYNVPECK